MMLLGQNNEAEDQRLNPKERAAEEKVSVAEDCSRRLSLRSCLSSSNLSTSTRNTNGGMGSRNVSFHEVKIREYDMTVSDNPSVSKGVPIGIDWGYEEQHAVCVNKYEDNRTPKTCLSGLKIPQMERRELLKKSGLSAKEIKQAEKSVNITRRKRRETNNMTPAMEKTSIVFEKVSRNIRKVVSLNSRERKLEAMMKRSSRYSLSHSRSAGDFTKITVQTSGVGKILSRRMSMPDVCEIGYSENESSEMEEGKAQSMQEPDNNNDLVPFSSSYDTKTEMESNNICLLDRYILERTIPTDDTDIDDLGIGMDIDF